MRKRSDSVEITFSTQSALTFDIEEGNMNSDGASFFIENETQANPGKGVVHELNDDEIVQYLLTQNPRELFVQYDNLSDGTKRYITDPANEPSSGLILFMKRSGHKYEVVLGQFPQVRIYV